MSVDPSSVVSGSSSISSDSTSPEIDGLVMLTRSKRGLQAYSLRKEEISDESKTVAASAILSEEIVCSDSCDVVFSLDGYTMCVCTEERIEMYCARTFRLLTTLPQKRVRKVWLSPRANFVIAFHNRQSPKDRNLKVWLWRESRCLMDWSVTSVRNPDYPPFAFSHDDSLFARGVQNKLNVYDCDVSAALTTATSPTDTDAGGGSSPPKTKKFSMTLLNSKDCPRVETLVFSPTFLGGPKAGTAVKKRKPYRLSVFRNFHKGLPASVEILDLDLVKLKKNEKDLNISRCVGRSFQSADEVELYWNKKGDALLSKVCMDVDASDSSYYGTQQLFVLDCKTGLSSVITTSESGPMQECQWHAGCNDEFLLVDGHPTRVSVFSRKGARIAIVVKDQPRNLIKFNHDGSLLWLGGFGNLNGEMSWFDTSNKSLSEWRFLGYNKNQSCRQFEWSPDSCWFVTARIAPFRQVDNGLTLYDYCGNECLVMTFDRLYQVCFRPLLMGQSRRSGADKRDKGPPLPSLAGSVRYIPPHLRGKGKGGGSKTPKLSKAAAAMQRSSDQPRGKRGGHGSSVTTKGASKKGGGSTASASSSSSSLTSASKKKTDADAAPVERWPRGARLKAREQGLLGPQTTDETAAVAGTDAPTATKKRRRKRKRRSAATGQSAAVETASTQPAPTPAQTDPSLT